MKEPEQRDAIFKRKADSVPRINQMKPVFFQGSLVKEDNGDELVLKKRRLTADQLNELEKCFEVENKLEPERKTELAEQLGLQRRQIAIWFQNRRARWKTKQLEKEFSLLQANYTELKLSFESLREEKEKLAVEVNQLRGRLEEKEENRSKEASDSDTSVIDNNTQPPTITGFIPRQLGPSLRLNCCSYTGSELGLHIPLENKVLDHHHMTKWDNEANFGNAEGSLNILGSAFQTTFPWAWTEHWAQ